ncbi:hypothetical protein QSA_1171 [Clostridioides difficile P21]|uniref:Uncharacterized protein n=3 Tax=root TaxID=1 RepID=A0A0A8WFM1_9CAUD|nr:hypothetical protein PHIMMP03_29059 [Clostridium phage phiMMP03]YP_009830923.1 hypothetical protein HWA98_gp52 [Clostridium phage CDKM15]EQE22046.1 hypothetical protein QAW_1262 [Clostridioides difficile CD17]EQE98758.1 hypothetical protein QCY_1088 [Clostridioides difficile CD70]EQG21900.1 hypothetical protein QIE_1129 [Clostridioides difficile DA00062]EQH72087.1 hypothetical protein QMQ_1084 [Clostridioides difficile DA00306]EQI44153.1 hypothetical protein QOS_0639 [Clostridioides diffic
MELVTYRNKLVLLKDGEKIATISLKRKFLSNRLKLKIR